MTGRIESAGAIGKCSVEIVGRNRVVIGFEKFKGDEFGVKISFLPNPEIANSGGNLLADWGWAPMSLEVSSQNKSELELERKANPFRMAIPKRTAGFDPRKITIEARWSSELLQILNELERDVFSFEISTEVSDDEISPVLFDFGRGMRSGGNPSLISNAILHNSQLYTPIYPFQERMGGHYRTYADGSIHIDKMGPYFFTSMIDSSVTGPLLNFSRVDPETWEGIERGGDDLLYAVIQRGDEEISGISHQACFFELLGLISKSIHEKKPANNERISNLVGHMIESIDEDGMWKHDFPMKIIDKWLDSGWTSWQTQSLGAMGLVRAGEYLGEPGLKGFAESAIEGAMESSELTVELNGWKIFRGYSGELVSCPLSSHLYTLMAIADLVEVRGTKKWRNLLKNAVEQTEKILPLYDLGNTTSFDLRHLFHPIGPKTSTPQYHSTHVMQLKWLEHKLDSDIVSETAKRWESYLY